MDGINGSKTLTSVVLAALSGAGYAVFRVMFRKMMGDPPPVGRIAFTFTIIGIINAALLWPICLVLYFFEFEKMPWETLTITVLLIASGLLLIFHILTQFSGAVTYNMFVTLGLITSVPVSACELLTVLRRRVNHDWLRFHFFRYSIGHFALWYGIASEQLLIDSS